MKYKNFENVLLVLLSGTPGTGKTSTLNELIDKHGWMGFSLGDYLLETGAAAGPDKKRDTTIIDDEIGAFKGLEYALELLMGKDVGNMESPVYLCIESHYADVIVDAVNDIVDNGNNVPVRLREMYEQPAIKNLINAIHMGKNIIGIILRCEPEELERRLKARGYPPEKIKENVQAEILGVCTSTMLEVLPRTNVCEIDTTDITYKEAAPKVISAAINFIKMGCLEGPEINWLEDLAYSDRLMKYFD